MKLFKKKNQRHPAQDAVNAVLAYAIVTVSDGYPIITLGGAKVSLTGKDLYIGSMPIGISESQREAITTMVALRLAGQ